jgi:hypothetical protein
MRDYLQPKGVQFELLIRPQLHARRCLLTGAGGTIELSTEWDMDFFLDSPDNFQRVPEQRRTLRTEVLVWRHDGPAAATTTRPTVVDERIPPPVGSERANRRDRLGVLLLRVLLASRVRSWRDRVHCRRCDSSQPAANAVIQLQDQSEWTIRFGGLPCRTAEAMDIIVNVQCSECAASIHGRGVAYEEQLPGDSRIRGALLANGAGLLCLLRRTLGMTIDVPRNRGTAPVALGTWNLRTALETSGCGADRSG